MLLNLRLYKEDNLILESKKVAYTKEKNKLFFEIEGMNHEIDLESKIFKRENQEYAFILDFDQEKCFYELKEYQATCDIIVDQAFFEQTQNRLEMIYVIETEDEKNKIIIEL
ncbi:MAG: hypothetical protein HFH86_03305 [Bacilli bacterium]|nr:hypothetical protein [Bacilli bacterium]